MVIGTRMKNTLVSAVREHITHTQHLPSALNANGDRHKNEEQGRCLGVQPEHEEKIKEKVRDALNGWKNDLENRRRGLIIRIYIYAYKENHTYHTYIHVCI